MCAFTSEQSNVTIMKSKPDQRGLNYLGWQRRKWKKGKGRYLVHRLHSSFTVTPLKEFYLKKGKHSNDYIYKTKYGCPYTCTDKSFGIIMHTAGIDHSVHYCYPVMSQCRILSWLLTIIKNSDKTMVPIYHLISETIKLTKFFPLV